MFEHKLKPLASKKVFINRVLRYALISTIIIFLSLFGGMIGYRVTAGIDWVEAFYNAAMILTGMGPALDIKTVAADRQGTVMFFAGCYALYSGVVFLVASSLILTPLLHRFFHQLHLDIE